MILETGMLPAQLIRRASELAIAAGADFLKTSTGKVAAGASLEAARIMLTVIRQHDPAVGFNVITSYSIHYTKLYEQFNDKYGEAADDEALLELDGDLDRLGQALEERFRLEDRLVKVS